MSRKWKADCRRENSVTAKNLLHNSGLAKGLAPGVINGQETEPVCRMRYGKHEMHHCGCEAIAVHNIMHLLGKPQPISQIIAEFEMNRMSLLFFSTVFGTSPKKLRRYFDAHGVKYDYFRRREEFLSAAKDRKYAIVSFWVNTYAKHRFNRFGSGLHTVALAAEKGGTITVFNRFNSDTQPRAYKDIGDLLSDRKFIAGYLF